jgi:hypothetical protein
VTAENAKPGLVFFYSERSGLCRRAEGYLSQVLQRRCRAARSRESQPIGGVAAARKLALRARIPSCDELALFADLLNHGKTRSFLHQAGLGMLVT